MNVQDTKWLLWHPFAWVYCTSHISIHNSALNQLLRQMCYSCYGKYLLVASITGSGQKTFLFRGQCEPSFIVDIHHLCSKRYNRWMSEVVKTRAHSSGSGSQNKHRTSVRIIGTIENAGVNSNVKESLHLNMISVKKPSVSIIHTNTYNPMQSSFFYCSNEKSCNDL